MAKEMFFKSCSQSFDYNKLEISSEVKLDWVKKSSGAASFQRYEKRIQILSDAIRFRQGLSVLDVGCGLGLQIIELAHLGANSIGLDTNRDCIRLINQLADDFNLNVRAIHGDSCCMPFEDESFDVVMSTALLEHVISVDAAIREQARVLKTGGILVIKQANLLSPWMLYHLLVKYPIRTRGKYGGLKWLFTKGRVIENIYGTGWTGKDEDIHSRWWWRKQIQQHSDLRIEEFTSYMAKGSVGSLWIPLAPFLGDILIIIKKV